MQFEKENSTVVNSTVGTDTWGFQHNTLLNTTGHFYAESVSLRAILLSTAVITIACTSGVLNLFLLWALSRIKDSIFAAKILICNVAIADLLLPFVAAFNHQVPSALFGSLSKSFLVCYSGIQVTLSNIILLAQPVCSLNLAFDRIYAVTLPFRYKMTGYTKSATVVVVAVPWILAISIWLTHFWYFISSFKMQSDGEVPKICLYLSTASIIVDEKMLDLFLIISNFLASGVQITSVLILRYKRQRIQNSIARLNNTKNLSVTVTFLLVTLSNVILFLPGPIVSFFTGGLSSISKKPNIYAVSLFMLYLLNACVDPVIFMKRIRSIRRNIPLRLPTCLPLGSGTPQSSVANNTVSSGQEQAQTTTVPVHIPVSSRKT